MGGELITCDSLTTELLGEILEAACLDYEKQDDESYLVKEELNVRLYVEREAKTLCMSVFFGFTEEASELDKLRFVNYINQTFVLVTASADEDSLFFHHHVLLNAGITRKHLVMSLKRFAGIPRSAVADATENLELAIVA